MATAQTPEVLVPAASSAPAIDDRRRAIQSALASTLAEGETPTTEALALGEQYAAGEITLEEFGAAVRALPLA